MKNPTEQPGEILFIYDANGNPATFRTFPSTEKNDRIADIAHEFKEGNSSNGLSFQCFTCKDISSYEMLTVEDAFRKAATNSTTIFPKIYIPELLFIVNKLKIAYPGEKRTSKYINDHYIDFCEFLRQKGIQDTERPRIDIGFLKIRSIINQRNNQSGNIYDIFTHDFLPLTLDCSQLRTIVDDLVRIQLKNSDFVGNRAIETVKAISILPERFRNKALENIVGKDIYSYYVLTHEKIFTHSQALGAMRVYASERFFRSWDPVGGIDQNGIAVGCEIEPYSGIKNPSDFFDHSLLSIKEWRSIADINPSIIKSIPKEILQNEIFWENFETLLGKGKYPYAPCNYQKYDHFDKLEILPYMPEKLKADKSIRLKFNLSLIKNNGLEFGHIPPKERTAFLCLFFNKYYPALLSENPNLIPTNVKKGNNIFTFSQQKDEYKYLSIKKLQELYLNEASKGLNYNSQHKPKL